MYLYMLFENDGWTLWGWGRRTDQMGASINKRNLIVATVIVAILSFDVTRILLQVSTTDGQRGAWGSVYFIMLLRQSLWPIV